jgi:putative hydrolase of the HAD superfamily
MKNAVIFDLDNTLYDQEEFIISAAKEISNFLKKKYGVASYKLLMEIFNSKTPMYPHTFDDLVKKLGLKVNIDKLVKIFHSHKGRMKMYKNTKPVLKKLRKYFTLYLVTDGNVAMQRNKVKILGLEDFFDKIIYARKYGESYEKPSNKLYRNLVKNENIDIKKSFFVADNPHIDFIKIKELGIKTIRIRRGIYRRFFLDESHEADYCVEDIQDCVKHILIKNF